MEREQVEERGQRRGRLRSAAVRGHAGLQDLGDGRAAGWTRSTITRSGKWHDAKPSLTASEASPDVAVQIYNRAIHNQMMARIKEGQSIKQVIAWAKDELEGFTR